MYRLPKRAWRTAEAAAARLRDAWSGLRIHWLMWDKSLVGLLTFMAVPLLVLGLVARFAHADQLRLHAERHRRAEVECLAENIYFEARGEPLAGQYAVAEVTLNRVASPRFPDTVCAVVHEARWDAARERYVGAFSWTVLDAVPKAEGLAWQRALAVAGAVYDNREAPFVDGALYYHATYVVPSWSEDKHRVKRIGRHLFYQ